MSCLKIKKFDEAISPMIEPSLPFIHGHRCGKCKRQDEVMTVLFK